MVCLWCFSYEACAGRSGNSAAIDWLVQQLCRDILNKKDSQKTEELISVLHAVIRDDQEEIRVRMAFLAKKYADVVSDSKAAD